MIILNYPSLTYVDILKIALSNFFLSDISFPMLLHDFYFNVFCDYYFHAFFNHTQAQVSFKKRYMAEILPIGRKTKLYPINQSKDQNLNIFGHSR